MDGRPYHRNKAAFSNKFVTGNVVDMFSAGEAKLVNTQISLN